MATPRLVTAAIVIEGENILLVQNKRNPNNVYWGFPGGVGAFEKVSDPAEAVKDEIMGDIACEFKGKFFMYGFREDTISTVTLFYVGYISGQPQPVCKNIADVKYFPIEEARKMKLPYEHNFILEKYIEDRTRVGI